MILFTAEGLLRAATRHAGRGICDDSKSCGGVMRVAPVGLIGTGRTRSSLDGKRPPSLTDIPPVMSARLLSTADRGDCFGEFARSIDQDGEGARITQPGHEVLNAIEQAETLSQLNGAKPHVETLGQGKAEFCQYSQQERLRTEPQPAI